jgi:membrane protein implicated in regulation of membrane protease activity
MKNVLKYSFLVSGVVLFLSVNAYAAAIVLQAPEIDLSLAIGGFSFLVGTLVVLRSRLRK